MRFNAPMPVNPPPMLYPDYAVAQMIAEAVAAERERCAKIADGMKQRSGPVADAIAAAIRGETP